MSAVVRKENCLDSEAITVVVDSVTTHFPTLKGVDVEFSRAEALKVANQLAAQGIVPKELATFRQIEGMRQAVKAGMFRIGVCGVCRHHDDITPEGNIRCCYSPTAICKPREGRCRHFEFSGKKKD